MNGPTTNERRLAIIIGALILAAATDVSIRKAGGYSNDYARLLLALAGGVFTGAYLMGRAWSMSKVLAITIAVTLGAGESYNLWQTAERVMNARETGRAPARAALKQHEDAEAAFKAAEAAEVGSARLDEAKAQKDKADSAYDKELREGGRCKTICEGLKAKADRAQDEVVAALKEAEGMKQAAIDRAKADLDAHPLPASGTASSDETGIAVWVLDLISAVLLSLGANGLAGALIAFGAHRQEFPGATIKKNLTVADAAQTDFDPTYAENIVRFFRPDGGTPVKSGPDRPKRPGPSGGLSKADAFDDLMQRLADGRTIPSDKSLASDWHRPKQTVHDWMKKWRADGIIPAATVSGRCKMTVAG